MNNDLFLDYNPSFFHPEIFLYCFVKKFAKLPNYGTMILGNMRYAYSRWQYTISVARLLILKQYFRKGDFYYG